LGMMVSFCADAHRLCGKFSGADVRVATDINRLGREPWHTDVRSERF
jgi:hypothetical protein